MTSTPLTIVNAQQCEHICVADRGLAYGDGVFETLRVDTGDIALWQYHYQRLLKGLRRLQIDVKQDSLRAHLKATIRAISCESGVLKLTVTRGQGGRGYQPPEANTATLISSFTAFTNDKNTHQQQGVAVHCCEQPLPINPLLAGIKSLNQLPYVLASKEREALAVEEGLLFNSEGHLIEATARNIFIVKGGELYTPPLQECGVAGVMRQLIIEVIAPQCAIKVVEIALTKQNLLLADEVFLSNSISHIWPVKQCEKTQWPVGKVTQQLQQAVRDFLLSDQVLSLSHSNMSE